MVRHTRKAAASFDADGPGFDQLGSRINPTITELRYRAQHEMRVHRMAERIHRTGPRPLGELLLELIDSFGWAIEQRMEAYARLDAHFIRSVGGDRIRQHLEIVPDIGGVT